MLPRTHRIRIRDEVGLREGEDGYGSLPGAENLVESWCSSGVASPSSSTSDEKSTQGFTYIEMGRREMMQKKSREREDEICAILKLGAFLLKVGCFF